jgi:hypothetical protein
MDKFRDDFHRFISRSTFQCLNQEELKGLNLCKARENIKL